MLKNSEGKLQTNPVSVLPPPNKETQRDRPQAGPEKSECIIPVVPTASS